MSERERRPRRRLPVEQPKVERALHPEVLDIEQAAKAVADRVLRLWQEKDLVTGVLYGEPNAGKTKFTEMVMAHLPMMVESKLVNGGELTGYDRFPDQLGLSCKLVYLIAELSYAVGSDGDAAYIAREAQQHGFPPADFTAVLVNTEIYKGLDPNYFVGKADFVINNPHQFRKPGSTV